MAERPDIFQYSNFREFLRDHFQHAKSVNKNYSYRYFGAKAGFSSPNFLYLIIKGERNLTKDYVPKFAEALKLSKKEQRYFEALVSFNQSKTPESKRYYLELIHGLLNTRIGAPLKEAHFEFLSKWHYSAIWEMTALPDFTEDPSLIRKRLRNKVSVPEIKSSIERMIMMGLLTRDEKGRLIRTEKDIATNDEVHHTAAYSFHQQMLSLAKETMAEIGSEKREIAGITMAVSERQFLELKKMVRDFRANVARFVSNGSDIPEKVLHLNLNLFPITNDTKKDGDRRE